MHLGWEEVSRIIREAFPKYRFILITSDVQPYSKLGDAYLEARKIRQGMFNEDILTGQMTPFDIRLPPYEIPAETIFSWTLPFNGLQQRCWPKAKCNKNCRPVATMCRTHRSMWEDQGRSAGLHNIR